MNKKDPVWDLYMYLHDLREMLVCNDLHDIKEHPLREAFDQKLESGELDKLTRAQRIVLDATVDTAAVDFYAARQRYIDALHEAQKAVEDFQTIIRSIAASTPPDAQIERLIKAIGK